MHQLPSRLPAPQRLLRGLALILPLLLAPLAHADGTFSDLAELGAHGARVSAMALDLDSGKVLGSLNPGERLTPASMTKMVTAATALHHWAADHDFPTRLLTQGNIDGNTLKGDLILQGGGDATLDDQALWSLVAQLRSTGITRVTGKLVVNPYPFGTVPCQTQDRCEAMTRSDTAYDAPLSSIGVDFGTWCIQVRPTQPGAPAQVRGCAVAKLPIPVDGTIQTVGARKKQTFWIERVTDQDGDELHVNGNIPYGRTVKVYRSMSDPARGAGLLLQEMLNEAGINVNGAVVIGKGGLPSPATTLASIATLSLREQLGRMLRYSNNYIADVLTLDLGTGGKDPAGGDLPEAAQHLSRFVARADNGLGSKDPPPPPISSGSGLTPENRMSARDFVALLRHEYLDPVNFPVFYGGLVVPRQAPFAFLRGGNANWLDRVALKTGTLNDPVSVFGIGGYLRKQDGGFIAFAIIVNGGPHWKHVPLYKALAAARGDVERLLAHH